MRLDEISTRLSGRMQEVTSRTGINFSGLFFHAVEQTLRVAKPVFETKSETDKPRADAPPVNVPAAASVSPVRPAGREAYTELIERIAGQYEVDPALITAVVQAESNFDPYLVSRAGAVGLMQLMPSTAAGLGVTDVYDPAQNIDGGVRYLLGQIIRFDGDILMALAAYNCGPYGLKSRGVTNLADPDQRALLPAETRKYLDNITGLLEAMGRADLLEEKIRL